MGWRRLASSLVLAAPALAAPTLAGASGLHTPVDLRNTTERPIFVDLEVTTCDLFSHPPQQTGCTVTSADRAAVFGAPLAAVLRHLGDNRTEVRVDSAVWDRTLKLGFHDPTRGILYADDSATDFVLTIDVTTGLPTSYHWSASLQIDGYGEATFVAHLLETAGGEAYLGLLDPPGLPAALLCQSPNFGSPPDPGQCEGSHFVPNESYDPGHGTLHHAARIAGPGDLDFWLPLDIRLREVPEPIPFSLWTAAGALLWSRRESRSLG